MSFWDTVFADSHFAPLATSLPFVSNDVTNLPPEDEFSSVRCLVDVEPIGYTYDRIVYPQNITYTVQIQKEDDIDPQELIDSIREADLNDYYSLLYLGHRQIVATEEEVRRNFKIINLYLHPDKADPSRRADAEIRFKAIQKAVDTLTNKQLKLEYDSELPFDNSIPSANAPIKSVEDFLALYYPVFERNARFSKVNPVPNLGDENSTEDELNKFYKFWFSFQSWREFASADTEKVGDSASRDERRQAAAKNKKAREEHKKKEILRIRNLTQRASDADPRMKAFKQKRLEEQKAAKAAPKGQAGKKGVPTSNSNKVAPKPIAAAGKRDPKQAIAQIAAERKRAEEEKKAAAAAAVAVKTSIAASEKTESGEKRQWTSEELALLAKATVKFPVGTKERWAKVAEFVNTINTAGQKRSEKDVIREIKRQELAMQAGGEEELKKIIMSGTRTDGNPVTAAATTTTTTSGTSSDIEDVESWTLEEQRLLEKGLTEIGKDVEDRWQLIANVVGTRTKAQCLSRFNYLRQKIANKKKAAGN